MFHLKMKFILENVIYQRQNYDGIGAVSYFEDLENVLLHEWQEDADGSKKPVPQIDYQAEYVVKLSEKKEQEERQKAAKGESDYMDLSGRFHTKSPDNQRRNLQHYDRLSGNSCRSLR